MSRKPSHFVGATFPHISVRYIVYPAFTGRQNLQLSDFQVIKPHSIVAFSVFCHY